MDIKIYVFSILYLQITTFRNGDRNDLFFFIVIEKCLRDDALVF